MDTETEFPSQSIQAPYFLTDAQVTHAVMLTVFNKHIFGIVKSFIMQNTHSIKRGVINE